MKRMCVLLVLALAATSRGADEDVVAKARAEFDAIAGAMESNVKSGWRAPAGPSLTKLVHDFVARDADVVRRAESDAWRDARHGLKGDGRRLAVEQTIRFLHGMPTRRDRGALIEYGERSGFDVVAGAVLLRQNHGSSYSGPGMDMFDGTYDDLVGKQPPRSPPSPSAAELLAVEVPEDRGFDKVYWSDSALIDFGMALGETCAKDDAGFTKLLARAIDRPRSRHLLLALGWSGRAEAVEFLSRSIRDLSAAGVWRGDYPYLPTAIDSAVTALRHADERAWQRVVASLSDEQSCRVLGTPTASEILLSRLAAIDSAKDADARRAAMLRLCRSTSSLCDLPSGEGATRVLRAMLACVDGGDDASRSAALDAVRTLFGGRAGRPRVSTYSTPDGSRRDEGTVLGLLGGPEATLRQAVYDTVAGRIAFRDSELPDSRKAPKTRGYGPASSDARQDLFGSGSDAVPVRVAASWTKDGLHLRLTNESRAEFTVNTVGLRYGIAEKVVVTTTPAGGAARSENRLRIDLGGICVCCSVPAEGLVRLRPKETFEWDLSVLPEFRGDPPLDVRIGTGFVVDGPQAAPVITFDWTRVL